MSLCMDIHQSEFMWPYSMACGLLLSLFVLMLRLSHTRPVGAPSSWHLCSLDMALSIFEDLLSTIGAYGSCYTFSALVLESTISLRNLLPLRRELV